MVKNLPGKESEFDPWVRKITPGEGTGSPSSLENPMDREAWQAIQFMGSQRVGHD